jgi:hypothetical protein
MRCKTAESKIKSAGAPWALSARPIRAVLGSDGRFGRARLTRWRPEASEATTTPHCQFSSMQVNRAVNRPPRHTPHSFPRQRHSDSLSLAAAFPWGVELTATFFTFCGTPLPSFRLLPASLEMNPAAAFAAAEMDFSSKPAVCSWSRSGKQPV